MTEFVLRIHCTSHPSEPLVEFLVDAGKLPRVTWPGTFSSYELLDGGQPTPLNEAANIAGRRPFVSQDVVGPWWRGDPPLSGVPEEQRWDEVRRVIYPDDELGRYTDPDGDGIHARYAITCLRPTCGERVRVNRPVLLALLADCHSRRHKLAAELAFLQGAGIARDWTFGGHEQRLDFSAPVEEGEAYPPTPMLNANLNELIRVSQLPT